MLLVLWNIFLTFKSSTNNIKKLIVRTKITVGRIKYLIVWYYLSISRWSKQILSCEYLQDLFTTDITIHFYNLSTFIVHEPLKNEQSSQRELKVASLLLFSYKDTLWNYSALTIHGWRTGPQ